MNEPENHLLTSLGRSFALVLAVFGVGIAGYLVIGWPKHGLLDAVYMTVITLTTVGYGEVIDLNNHPTGRIFTILLLTLGVGAFLNFVSALTAFWVEGQATHMFWRRRMDRSLAALEGHIIVCGAGHTGTAICRELVDTRRDFAVIEHDTEHLNLLSEELGEVPIVIGDATDDDVLLAAGIKRASAVICCISTDQQNLIVALSARILSPDLRIISRCVEHSMQAKILKAGADRVISPNRIGGLRRVSEAVRPGAVDDLDRMLRDRDAGMRVESTTIEPNSALDGQTIGHLRTLNTDLYLLAIRRSDVWEDHPTESMAIRAGDPLVYTGGPKVRLSVEHLAQR